MYKISILFLFCFNGRLMGMLYVLTRLKLDCNLLLCCWRAEVYSCQVTICNWELKTRQAAHEVKYLTTMLLHLTYNNPCPSSHSHNASYFSHSFTFSLYIHPFLPFLSLLILFFPPFFHLPRWFFSSISPSLYFPLFFPSPHPLLSSSSSLSRFSHLYIRLDSTLQVTSVCLAIVLL